MGYLFIFITLLAGCVKGYCGKKAGGLTEKFSDFLLLNIIRMSVCILIGGILLFINTPAESIFPGSGILTLAAISGIVTAVFVTSWLLSVQNGAYMLAEISVMLGIVFVVAAGSIVFKESVSILQIAGILLLFFSVVFMNLYQKNTKGKLSISAALALLVCGISSGAVDFTQKIFAENYEKDMLYAFQFYTYLFACLTLILLYFIFSTREKKSAVVGPSPLNKEKTPSFLRKNKKVFIYIPVMSVCLYINSYFKTSAAALLPSAILYPMLQGLSLAAGTLMAAIFFKEKPTKSSVAGVIIAFIAVLLIKS